MKWTQLEAIELCRKVEEGCPAFGCHVALTGGLLYKEGDRKDCDLLFYRIRQIPEIDMPGLFNFLESIGLETPTGFGWVYKSKVEGPKSLDLFFPEEQGGEYTEEERAECRDAAEEARVWLHEVREIKGLV